MATTALINTNDSSSNGQTASSGDL